MGLLTSGYSTALRLHLNPTANTKLPDANECWIEAELPQTLRRLSAILQTLDLSLPLLAQYTPSTADGNLQNVSTSMISKKYAVPRHKVCGLNI
jgi:hypothetical protein